MSQDSSYLQGEIAAEKAEGLVAAVPTGAVSYADLAPGTAASLASDPALTATYGRLTRFLKYAPVISQQGLPAVAATPPALTMGAANAASSITSAVQWTPDIPGCFTFKNAPVAFYTASGVWDTQHSQTYTSAPPFAVEFNLDTVDATGRFELYMRGNGAGFRVGVWQNGHWEWASVGASFHVPSDGSMYRGLVTLGAPGRYTIRCEGLGNSQFGGIFTGPTDAVRALEDRPIKCVVIGDSFVEPTIADNAPYPVTGATGQATGDTITKTAHGLTAGSPITFSLLTGGTGLALVTQYYVVNPTANTFQVALTYGGAAVDITGDYSAVSYSQATWYGDGFTLLLSHLTGWDVRASGSGGTGYLNPGSGRVKFRDRLSEITSQNPDIIIWAGGINDSSYGGYSYAALLAEATACYAAAKAALPTVVQIAVSPFWTKDVTTAPAGLLQAADAIQAAAIASGIPYGQMIPGKLTALAGYASTHLPDTLQASATAGDTSVSITQNPSGAYTYMLIGNPGSNTREVRKRTNSSGSGPYSIQFNGTGGGGGLGSNHTAGESVTFVAPYILTGTGHQTATTGSGNADRFTGTDGTHPTIAGHSNLAWQILRQVLAAIT